MQTLYNVARRNKNVLNLPPVFSVDLHIDPDAPQAQDDAYRLLNEDGSVHQERTVRDDARVGDHVLTLLFTGLVHGCRYSLEVDLGAEGRYFAFYDVPLADLIETVANPSATVASEEVAELPESFLDVPDDKDWPALGDSSLLPSVSQPAPAEDDPASIADGAGQLIL